MKKNELMAINKKNTEVTHDDNAGIKYVYMTANVAHVGVNEGIVHLSIASSDDGKYHLSAIGKTVEKPSLFLSQRGEVLHVYAGAKETGHQWAGEDLTYILQIPKKCHIGRDISLDVTTNCGYVLLNLSDSISIASIRQKKVGGNVGTEPVTPVISVMKHIPRCFLAYSDEGDIYVNGSMRGMEKAECIISTEGDFYCNVDEKADYVITDNRSKVPVALPESKNAQKKVQLNILGAKSVKLDTEAKVQSTYKTKKAAKLA